MLSHPFVFDQEVHDCRIDELLRQTIDQANHSQRVLQWRIPILVYNIPDQSGWMQIFRQNILQPVLQRQLSDSGKIILLWDQTHPVTGG